MEMRFQRQIKQTGVIQFLSPQNNELVKAENLDQFFNKEI